MESFEASHCGAPLVISFRFGHVSPYLCRHHAAGAAAAAPAAAAGVGAKNVFDNAIVIADEVHNLLIHLNSNQCKLLPHQVQTATNPTMIGLAGTPLLRPPAQTLPQANV